ncbi:MAG: cation:proton antiporter [Polyangiaceae bacterium]
MGHVPFLDELAVVCALGVLVTVLLAKLRLPTVAGLLASGALLGPFGLRLVTSVHAIEILAEVGVVLLLFTIGLEFSLKRLRSIFRQVAIGGGVQVGLTTLAALGIAKAFGVPTGRAIFYGFVFALSSTAIVLRALGERRELDAPHGKFIVGALIFQDLCVVPMVLVVPLLGTGSSAGAAGLQIGLAMGKAAVVVVLVVGVSRYVVPKVLGWVDASRSREVFLLAILALCIGTAWLTSLAGLSLALGAFLGGMVVADTEYGHRAMGDMLPLRDAFVSIFFVSLGMLFDVRVLLESPWLVMGLLVGFLVGKGILATLAAVAMRFPARVAWLAGVGLAQFGEFGFVLTRLAQSNGLVTERETAPLLAAGIASMFLTPLLVRVAPHLTAGERLLAPLERLIGVRGIDEADAAHEEMSGHVVIVGFGLAGRYAGKALAAAGVPYVVLELNADTVRHAKARKLPVFYADATSEEALSHAHVANARLVVLLMNDPQAASRIVDTLKRVAPEVPVLMRTRYLVERDVLRKLGARDVVAEEVEGAIEVIARMLRAVDVPTEDIDGCVSAVRRETQTGERAVAHGDGSALAAGADVRLERFVVARGSPVAGASIASTKLRSEMGAVVVAVLRDHRLELEIDPSRPVAAGDTLYVVGASHALERAATRLLGKSISLMKRDVVPAEAETSGAAG